MRTRSLSVEGLGAGYKCRVQRLDDSPVVQDDIKGARVRCAAFERENVAAINTFESRLYSQRTLRRVWNATGGLETRSSGVCSPPNGVRIKKPSVAPPPPPENSLPSS